VNISRLFWLAQKWGVILQLPDRLPRGVSPYALPSAATQGREYEAIAFIVIVYGAIVLSYGRSQFEGWGTYLSATCNGFLGTLTIPDSGV
jgi:hypothetical protein